MQSVDVFICTAERPDALIMTLTSLLTQKGQFKKHLWVLDSGRKPVVTNPWVTMLLRDFNRNGWEAVYVPDYQYPAPGIARLRAKATSFGTSPYFMFVDDDLRFDDHTVIAKLLDAIEAYDVGFTQPMLNEDPGYRTAFYDLQHYWKTAMPFDEDGYADAWFEFGCCQLINGRHFERAKVNDYWNHNIIFGEDSIMSHLLKRQAGAIMVRDASVTHFPGAATTGSMTDLYARGRYYQWVKQIKEMGLWSLLDLFVRNRWALEFPFDFHTRPKGVRKEWPFQDHPDQFKDLPVQMCHQAHVEFLNWFREGAWAESLLE